MKTIQFNQITFLTSVASEKQLPPDEGAEVVFTGRSNAGKSSALNTLTRQKKLARVSKTPGRTQFINFFSLDAHRRLVDLPGYGYAKVPEAMKARWEKSVGQYLLNREALKGLVLLMDSRHPLSPYDYLLLDLASHRDLPVHILLTKADKLSRNKAMSAFHQVRHVVETQYDNVSIQLFSAVTKQGIVELEAQLTGWLNIA